jgi:ATP-dependent RNA helicase DeaD
LKKESNEPKSGTVKGSKKRPVRNRRGGTGFEWGEVDNVSQEDMLLPAQKKKGSRKKRDHVESTLTVGGEEVDPYAIKPVVEHPAPPEFDLAIPSYGKMLENEDDEFSVFLRNAEKADIREKEKLVQKALRAKPRSKKPATKEPGTAPVEKKPARSTAPPKRKKARPFDTSQSSAPRGKAASSEGNNPLANFRDQVDAIRTYGIDRINKLGLSEDVKEKVSSSLMTVEQILGLVDTLLHIATERGDAPADEPTAIQTAKSSSVQSTGKNVVGPAGKHLSRAESESKPSEPKRAKTAPKARSGGSEVKEKRRKEAESSRRPSPARPGRSTVPEQPGASESFARLRESWTFDGIVLSNAMLEMLAEVHYDDPTPIQAETIPKILAGKDVMGQSRTGSGKTAAFMIPIIERIEGCEPGDDPVALIVVPTRELAVQIRDETAKLAHNREIAIVACYGGKPIADQIKKMRGGVDIVVGTPGRILDLTKRRALSLSSLKWVVLDEADRMLDIGFRPDIERILRQTPRTRQTLLFSATLADEVVRLAQRYMTEPETCDCSENEIAADTIEQYYITVDRERKFEALVRLLRRENPQQAIIFCRTKRGVDKLGNALKREFKEWTVSAIHGDLTQSNRDTIMRSFRAGKIKLLVATDVVGRGIDVSGISHIINYDIPEFCDDYIHRVGRTGRMGREGVAFTLVTSEEGNELTRIEMRINRLLRRTELEGFEAFTRPDDPEKSEPKEPKPVFGKPLRRIRRAL